MFRYILLSTLFIFPTYAADLEDVAARVNRMEHRLSLTEKKLFNGTTSNTNGASAFADFELRLQELEKENATLYGSVEQLGNAVEQLAKQVKDMNDDTVLRLQDIEQQMQNGFSTGAASAVKKPVEVEKSASVKPEVVIEKPEHLKIPEDLNAQKIYRTAYKALTSADYEKSALWFSAVIDRFPKENLAENAHYWLGEIHLVENKPTDAIVALKNGLVAFPNGSKAPSYLLKMGEAFIALDKKKHAKSVWEKLITDYGDSLEAEKVAKSLEALAAEIDEQG